MIQKDNHSLNFEGHFKNDSTFFTSVIEGLHSRYRFGVEGVAELMYRTMLVCLRQDNLEANYDIRVADGPLISNYNNVTSIEEYSLRSCNGVHHVTLFIDYRDKEDVQVDEFQVGGGAKFAGRYDFVAALNVVLNKSTSRIDSPMVSSVNNRIFDFVRTITKPLDTFTISNEDGGSTFAFYYKDGERFVAAVGIHFDTVGLN